MKSKKSKSKLTKVPKKAKVSAAKTNRVGLMPMGERVLVKPLSKEEAGAPNAFGIIIPDTAKEKPEQGTVVAVGPGKKSEDGKVIPLSVKVGERVMFSKYGYDEVKVAGVEYYLVPEGSILGILNS